MRVPFDFRNLVFGLLAAIGLPLAIFAAAPSQPSWDMPQPGNPKGNLASFYFKSRLLKNKREIWVYTPADYRTNGSPFPLLIVLDGQAYTSQLIPGPTILDNLIADGQIAPLVAVFISSIDQPQRNLELPCYAPFIDSLAVELLPWIYTHYHVSHQPDQTIIAGSSYGGLAAAYAALRKPELFGNVLSQSGAFWWQPSKNGTDLWLIKQYENSPKLPVKFYLDVGDQEIDESTARMSMVKVNRCFSDLLKRRGYEYSYQEFKGGHDYDCWKQTFATGLISLIGMRRN